jgi:transposase
MPVRPVPFPPLPADTVCAAKSVFHMESLYLAIGDQLDLLFGDLNRDDLDAFSARPLGVSFILAMVTIFQFAEDLPDHQAAEALRTRMDWKYALHLPLGYPGFDPSELSEFRQRLLYDTAGQRVFQRMLTRLAKLGLLGSKDKRRADVTGVLRMVGTLSRVEKLAEAMSLALEALAARQPDWLRAISLPHWYERYGPKLATLYRSSCKEEHEALARAIGADISYLLEAITKADAPDLARLPEVQALEPIMASAV